MKFLLDTQAFLWMVTDNSLVSKKIKKLFLDQENIFYLSLVSIWEMSIKMSLGKLKVQQPFEKFILNQLQENFIEQLPIHFRHVTKVRTLPFHHRDPFDRLLIAQSLIEDLPVVSSDSAFAKYGISVLW